MAGARSQRRLGPCSGQKSAPTTRHASNPSEKTSVLIPRPIRERHAPSVEVEEMPKKDAGAAQIRGLDMHRGAGPVVAVELKRDFNSAAASSGMRPRHPLLVTRAREGTRSWTAPTRKRVAVPPKSDSSPLKSASQRPQPPASLPEGVSHWGASEPSRRPNLDRAELLAGSRSFA